MTRRCNKCGRELPATEEFFHVVRRRPGVVVHPLKSTCKACIAARNEEWRRDRMQATDPVDRERGLRIPIEPFREWLHGRLAYYESLKEFAEAVQVEDRTLWRWLHESEGVHLDRVDRVLVNDGTASLGDLYPGLYEFDEWGVAA